MATGAWVETLHSQQTPPDLAGSSPSLPPALPAGALRKPCGHLCTHTQGELPELAALPQALAPPDGRQKPNSGSQKSS